MPLIVSLASIWRSLRMGWFFICGFIIKEIPFFPRSYPTGWITHTADVSRHTLGMARSGWSHVSTMNPKRISSVSILRMIRSRFGIIPVAFHSMYLKDPTHLAVSLLSLLSLPSRINSSISKKSLVLKMLPVRLSMFIKSMTFLCLSFGLLLGIIG